MTGGMILTHEQARALVHKGLQARLDEFEHAAVTAHLAGCADCAAYAAEMRAVDRRLAASLPERWPERSYTALDLNRRLAGIESRARRDAIMKQVLFFARLAGTAAALVLLVIGLAWLVRGSTWRTPAPLLVGSANTATFAIAGEINGCPHPQYLVRRGDTLSAIAATYGVTVDAIAQLNHLAGDAILEGQILKIPACAPRPVSTSTPPAASTQAATQGVEQSRLTLEQAEKAVRDWIFANNPDMNPSAAFPLKEITTDEVRQRMGVQVFKVTEGVKLNETFVLAGGGVYPIGTAFGGMGVSDLLVTDLDGNGSPELIYPYGFGSGIHQSAIGMFYLLGDRVVTWEAGDLHYLGDLALEKKDDRTVIVTGARQGQAQPEPLGQLHWLGDGTALILTPLGEAPVSYTSPRYGVTFQYPDTWQPYAADSYRGESGFFKILLLKQGILPQDLARFCEMEANSNPATYGSQPGLTLLSWENQFQACLIESVTSGPDAHSAVLFMPDASSIALLSVDAAHAQLVASSLRATRPMPTAQPAAIDLTPRAPDPASKVTTRAAGPLTLSEYPVVSASVDTPGHMEYLARIPNGQFPFSVFPHLVSWYDQSQDLALAQANQALQPFGYRLVMRQEPTGHQFDLYKGSEKVRASLAMFFPVSAYRDEQGQGDFAMLVEDAQSQRWLVRKDGIQPWDDMTHHYTRPVIASGGRLITVERQPSDANGQTDRALIKQDGQTIFTYVLTPAMVEEPVKTLSVWNGGWVLEVNGTLIVDGAIYNQKDFPADEIFNWTLLNGQPFFFFRRDGKVGAWFNGQELPVQYDEVLHGGCCESAAFNVYAGQDALWFHARRDGVWYYAELRVAGK